MGQVIVDVPQNVFRSYHVDDSEFGEQLLRDLDENSDRRGEDGGMIPPRRNSMAQDGDAALGIWSDREEIANEIAQKVREGNRRVT